MASGDLRLSLTVVGLLRFGSLGFQLSGFLGLRRDVEVEGFRVQGFWVF